MSSWYLYLPSSNIYFMVPWLLASNSADQDLYLARRSKPSFQRDLCQQWSCFYEVAHSSHELLALQMCHLVEPVMFPVFSPLAPMVSSWPAFPLPFWSVCLMVSKAWSSYVALWTFSLGHCYSLRSSLPLNTHETQSWGWKANFCWGGHFPLPLPGSRNSCQGDTYCSAGHSM